MRCATRAIHLGLQRTVPIVTDKAVLRRAKCYVALHQPVAAFYGQFHRASSANNTGVFPTTNLLQPGTTLVIPLRSCFPTKHDETTGAQASPHHALATRARSLPRG